MKLVVALWDADRPALLEAPLRTGMHRVGVTRLQVNLDDDHVPGSALRLQQFEAPLTSVVTVWTEGAAAGVVEALRPYADAVVEELFPAAGMHDIHAFYGSGGDQAELDRRLTRLMESVATMGADRDLDVVPTSRYVWGLRGDVGPRV